MRYPYEPQDYVRCTCCGIDVRNVPGENVYLNLPDGNSYPSDDGYGMCIACGGDPSADVNDTSEANIRKRLGYGMIVFYNARIEIMERALNPENAALFKKLDYASKISLVIKAVEDGLIV
ncbi:MAG: hypothetical protein Q8S00_32320 [Deltaproteobacteria bacterium]|nr:hypothetical protein [Deltaproteobacteria bacterium]